jgi:alpha-L-rhamnosidase
LELLSGAGLTEQLLHESRAYLLYMAERTGTLWENVTARASLDHAFASHIVKTLYRDVLGVYEIDIPRKKVMLRFADSSLEWCKGDIPVPVGFVSLRWKIEKGILKYHLDVPASYSVAVSNIGTHTLSQSIVQRGVALGQ